MAAFSKFDPGAFLEREKRATSTGSFKPEPHPGNNFGTLATLATLAASLSQNENRDVGQSSATVNHQHCGENRKSEPAPAKVAKVAKVELSVAAIGDPRWGETEEERAAIAEYDGGAPRAWAEALARLDPNKPPRDVPPRRWLSFVDDCGCFLDGGWAARAAAFGWGPLDLFGCDRVRPFARVDHLGLLWLLNGASVVELHRDRAILETQRGTRQCYRRRPVEVGRVVLAWELSP